MFLLLACSDALVEEVASLDTATPPSDEAEESGGETGGETGSEPESAYALGIEEVSTSGEAYAPWGYRITTFSVTAAHPIAITSADGLPPRFQVLWPAVLDPDRDYPVLLHLHGGSMDVDDNEQVEGRCSAGQAFGQELVDGMMADSGLAYLAASQGWIVLAPENSFCDGWVGMGPDDDTDTSHGGYALSQIAMDYLRYGRDDLSVGAVYAGGVSLGGLGAMYFTHYYPDVSAALTDCGATDMVRFYYEEGYSPVSLSTRQERYLHTFGAPPYTDAAKTKTSPAWPRYRALGLIQAVREGTLALPLLHIHSSGDTTSPPIQHEDVVDTLREHYDPAGIRWLDYDVGHDRPGHTQLNSVSAMYVAWAALRFLEGQSVAILEAEHAADADLIGAAVVDTAAYGTLSGSGLRSASPQDGAGILYRSAPVQPGAGLPVRAVVFLQASQAQDLTAQVATLRLLEDGQPLQSLPLTAQALSFQESDGPARVAAIEATTLSSTAGGGALTVEVEVAGTARVDVDVVMIDW